VTDNLDNEVTMLDSNIHSFMQDMQDMGLNPQDLDANAPLLPPTLNLDQQQPSLHPLATQLPAHLSETEPQPSPSSSSSLPSPSTFTDPFSILQVPPPTSDDFDMYRFFDVDGPNDDDGVDADVDDWDPSTAFVDDVQVPPEPERRVSTPHVSSKKSGGGKKRKSDVALGEVQMEVTAPPALEPEPALSGQPPKRGGVKMKMNVTRRPAKRRKNH
jgi:heat shock transcription factor